MKTYIVPWNYNVPCENEGICDIDFWQFFLNNIDIF